MTETNYSSDDILLFADAYARKQLNPDQNNVLREYYNKIQDEAEKQKVELLSKDEMENIMNDVPGAKEAVGAYKVAYSSYIAKMN